MHKLSKSKGDSFRKKTEEEKKEENEESEFLKEEENTKDPWAVFRSAGLGYFQIAAGSIGGGGFSAV